MKKTDLATMVREGSMIEDISTSTYNTKEELDKLIEDYSGYINNMISLRTQLDTYLTESTISTWRAEAMIDIEDKVNKINEEAECTLALIRAFKEQN